VAFDDCAGWLHDAPGTVGVLFCSPWGYEELCMRRAWRMLADALAEAGFPCLRFDYPGTGDSLGEPSDLTSLAPFTDAAARAAGVLRAEAGVTRLVLIGQGFGAAVAALAAPTLVAEGMVLLAPLVRGRDHLRELTVWSALVADTMSLTVDPANAGSVAGFDLPPALAEAVAELDLAALEAAPAPASLIVARPGRAGEQRLAESLTGLGVEVTQTPYEGYEAALGSPTSARPPVAAIDAVGGWLKARFPQSALQSARRPEAPAPSLAGPRFVETPVRLGPDRRLFAVLCEPTRRRRGATVLMLSAGGDPHIGWARSSVDHARVLAGDGVASLRLDASDVGDSHGALSVNPPRFYDENHITDALSAVDWLEARGLGPVLPIGRCSGAFIAFNAALHDARVKDLVLVNQQRFVWDPKGRIEIASDTVRYYRRRASSPATLLQRSLRGDLDMRAVLAKAGSAALQVGVSALRGHGRRLNRTIAQRFATLADRGVHITLVYSRDDEAHREFAARFGEPVRFLDRYPTAELAFVDEADHGLTPPGAREALLRIISERALSPPASSGARIAPGQAAAGGQDLALGRRRGGRMLAAH
jgi:pimeloyl-ACP methyl ester carboxylesterase